MPIEVFSCRQADSGARRHRQVTQELPDLLTAIVLEESSQGQEANDRRIVRADCAEQVDGRSREPEPAGNVSDFFPRLSSELP